MAAKLKKRALAEFQTQTQVIEEVKLDEPEVKRPRLKLILHRGSGSSASSSSSPSISPRLGQDLQVLSAQANWSEVSAAIVRIVSRLHSFEGFEVVEIIKKLVEVLKTPSETEQVVNVKSQICIALAGIMQLHVRLEEAMTSVKTAITDLLARLRGAKTSRLSSSFLSLLSTLLKLGLITDHVFLSSAREYALVLTTGTDIQSKINALLFLGQVANIPPFCKEDIPEKTLALGAKFTQSSDPRIRLAAFETLLIIHEHCQDSNLKHQNVIQAYKSFCRALKDDFDCVRLVALKLVHVMALKYPEEKVRVSGFSKGKGSSPGRDFVRLPDDAFAKICNGINDGTIRVRELAAQLIGDMKHVSQEFLEQTLDKKLMSNMRLKKSAHEREAKMVSSGEWSSGKKWADDAPKEELDADTVNLMSFGACGAFIHGLEDEFLAVRSASIESLTRLSTQNQRLASLALDFLVDMFNDEIESVRIKAIDSLRRIAQHISLQVHQLETILSALDDYSIVVREKLHIMLQASTIATKDGLQNVINKLLENLKKYPQDRRSILATFKVIGERHSELTLPLVAQLLEIHPFFDTAEPDIEDPAYLSVLVLIFNAAQHCPTMEPLFDEHTKRHYHYMLDTYPNLMPARQLRTKKSTVHLTQEFLKETLARVSDSETLSMESRIKVLEQAGQDMQRLSLIEPSVSDSAQFTYLYIQSQALFLSTLSKKFWINPHSLSSQELAVIESNVARLHNLYLQLRHRFINLSEKQNLQIRILKINILALQNLYLVKASNKSALMTNELLLKEAVKLSTDASDEAIAAAPFISALFKKLGETDEYHKPGVMVRILQPLLLAHPLEPLEFNDKVAQSRAVIYEPQGMNETPLKYTAGMVLAVPVDCELHNVTDVSLVRIAIKTPDQKIQLVTPKSSQFLARDESNCPGSSSSTPVYRLLTDALMSHSIWSEALHVDISIVLDLSQREEDKRSAKSSNNSKEIEKNIVRLCDPVKVYVLPKTAKRGI